MKPGDKPLLIFMSMLFLTVIVMTVLCVCSNHLSNVDRNHLRQIEVCKTITDENLRASCLK